MDETVLRKLQLTEFEILKDFDQLCKKHRLQYFLEGGTLLGAVRHGGFIPWDDDVDVLMPREDYLKLIALYKQGKIEGYFLQCIETDGNCWYFFAKLRKENTVFIPKEEKNIKSHRGAFIDIFPIEGVEKKGTFNLKAADYIHPLLRAVMSRRMGTTLRKENKKAEMVWKIMQILLSPFSNVKLQHFGNLFIRGTGKRKCRYYYRAPINMPDKQMNRYWPMDKVYPAKKLNFEGYEFPVFSDYHWYLEQLYGKTYMQLPPEKDRITHEPWKIEIGDVKWYQS